MACRPGVELDRQPGGSLETESGAPVALADRYAHIYAAVASIPTSRGG